MRFQNIPTVFKVENTVISQLPIETATKSLCVTYTPHSNWTEQFNVMKGKMEESKKLMATHILPHQVHTLFHTYLIRKVFFGCGVIKLTDEQDDILCKLFEITILKKLGLSVTYPRALLYVSKTSMGVGLLRPKIIIAQLQVKLYVRYTRINSTTYNEMCTIQETL